MISISNLPRPVVTLAATAILLAAMGGTWTTSRTATAAPTAKEVAARRAGSGAGSGSAGEESGPRRTGKKAMTGKLNLNTATEEQLMMLPTVGPAKAERIVIWRKKNGGFKRIADLRRVKGFGYKTFKRLEPLLAIKGETTLGEG